MSLQTVTTRAGRPLGPVRIVELVWLLAHPLPSSYDSPAMLSRAKEARYVP
jgi:hypothetical protein